MGWLAESMGHSARRCGRDISEYVARKAARITRMWSTSTRTRPEQCIPGCAVSAYRTDRRKQRLAGFNDGYSCITRHSTVRIVGAQGEASIAVWSHGDAP